MNITLQRRSPRRTEQPMPGAPTNVTVDDRSMSETFGGRITVDLCVPAFALYDLRRNDSAELC